MSRWKWLGLAAVVGVVAAGVAAQRSRRSWQAYDTDALRTRLHDRLAQAEAGAVPVDVADPAPAPAVEPAPRSRWRRRSHRWSRPTP